MAPTVLIADDQADVREALRLLLKSEGIASQGVDTPSAVMAAIHASAFACVLIDCNYQRDTTSGEEGLALIDQLRGFDPALPIVAMTAWGNVPLTVEAMRRGAADFIEKPWDNARLLQIIRTQLSLGDALQRQRRLEAENELLRTPDDGRLIAESAAMRRALSLASRIAPSDANILVLGENGTGKGALVHWLHQQSARSSHPLVKVNMGGISESVFESEMFGHVRGAFTDAKSERLGRFELADGGTLFLDEIGNLPLSQQPKLLRVLEEGEFERLGSSRTQTVDARVIAATNADLGIEVAAGRFRQDLLYRLNTFEVRLPPLRERSEDIIPLARAFLARSGARYRRDALRLSAAAERVLLSWSWPGNVRELQHLMERAALLADSDDITPAALPFGSTASPGQAFTSMTLEEAERVLIKHAMERLDGNLQKVADGLGITRQSLYRRLEKHGLSSAGMHDTTD